MTETLRTIVGVSGAALLSLASCGGGGGGSGASGDASSGNMELAQVSNGFGRLLPHTILRLDANGEPTSQIVDIRREEDLFDNLRTTNEVRSSPLFGSGAILSNGQPGNHYLLAQFTGEIDLDSVLDGSPGAQAVNGLTGSISVVAFDATTGESSPVDGVVFALSLGVARHEHEGHVGILDNQLLHIVHVALGVVTVDTAPGPEHDVDVAIGGRVE